MIRKPQLQRWPITAGSIKYNYKKSKKCYECSGEKRTKYYNIILDREATRLIVSNSKNIGLNEPRVRRLKISPSVSTPNSVDHY